jgi:hypothetical protein
VRAAFGAVKFERLAQLKSKYDPLKEQIYALFLAILRVGGLPRRLKATARSHPIFL